MSDPASVHAKSVEHVVVEMERAWADAHIRADVEDILALYTPDVLFFGSSPQMFSGREGVRDYLGKAGLGKAKSIVFSDRQARWLSGDIIVSAAFVVIQVASNGQSVPWRAGFSWTLKRTAEGWKIASHHASTRSEGDRTLFGGD